MAPTAASTQIKILAQLMEVTNKVNESVSLGRGNATALDLLRTELGLNSQHGRLPIIEATLTRHEMRADRLEARVAILETEEQQQTGREKLKSVAISLLTGSAGAAVIALLAHLIGH